MTPDDPHFSLTQVLPGNWMYDCGPIDPGAHGEHDPGGHLHGHVLADTWEAAVAQLESKYPGGKMPSRPTESS